MSVPNDDAIRDLVQRAYAADPDPCDIDVMKGLREVLDRARQTEKPTASTLPELQHVTTAGDGPQTIHPALFYRGVEEYLEGTMSFIRAGLAAGEPVAIAVPSPNLQLILAELGTDADRVSSMDMMRVGRNPARIIPGVLHAFADAHPHERVRIVSEPVWVGRTTTEYPACAQHEALINLAFAGRSVTILCPYDAEGLGPQVLADAEATHPLIIDASGERTSTTYAPERIVAEYNRPLPAPVAARITFDATTLAQARRFATEQAARIGLRSDHTELELLVGELTANSVAHGGGSGSLSIWVEDGYLVCEVRDKGHITDPLAGRRPAGRNQLSGRGLLLVNHLADLVRLYTGPDGTTVRLHLGLPSRTPEPPAVTHVSTATRSPGAGQLSPPDRTPLRWQTDDALRAAARFARYLSLGTEPSIEPDVERRQMSPVLEALAATDVLAQVVELWRTRLVSLARQRGARWTEIGRALGVSKQAAHERYGGTRRRTGRGGNVDPGGGQDDPRLRSMLGLDDLESWKR